LPILLILLISPLLGTIFGTVRGIAHDPDHRPVPDANVSLQSASSQYTQTGKTDSDGEFQFSAVPVGEYRISVTRDGFAPAEQSMLVTSASAAVLHFQFRLATAKESVEVHERSQTVSPEAFTSTTVVSRNDVDRTPGGDQTNSLRMITSFVPGAYITHDLLHIRGGHQVSWLIDGVPVPNTSIASNVGVQFDPKDIDYLEVQRGSYSAEYGDRTYGVFNVVPRTGFERNNEAELTATYGSFHQTNDHFTFGSHTERFAYYVGLNGNRSDLGLATPTSAVIHDRGDGLGGFGSLIYNRSPKDQLRLIAAVRRDDYQIPNAPDDQESGVRDRERERDALVNFSWVHAAQPGLLLTASPFYHFNRADYLGGADDPGLSTLEKLDAQYGGAQVTLSGVSKRHNARVGVYAYGERDSGVFGLTATGGGGPVALQQQVTPSGGLVAVFLEDQLKINQWLTVNGGVRLSRFRGSVSENAADPRIGAAVRVPRLNWVLRGFYGRFYQAPPLSTVSGPLLAYALDQGFGFLPLHGERNEEHQFGIAIPFRGWTLDADHFHTKSRNFFDHDALGNSNIFLPLTLQGARVDGWEATLRSPMLLRRGQMHLAYSSQRAEGWGERTGGLTFFAPPDELFLLDHDQRHTLSLGGNVNLPRTAWIAANLYYGSGFPDNGGPARLPRHTTFDLSLGKSVGERWSVAVQAVNVANRRFLLDNSLTFGGTHYFDPRQVYAEVRYRFHF
jgi:TonB dependent receptor/Carboxypeptidase regulatory-like domain/TonB-dependent Receptor Plug Domain